jgi:hypothetical protein
VVIYAFPRDPFPNLHSASLRVLLALLLALLLASQLDCFEYLTLILSF